MDCEEFYRDLVQRVTTAEESSKSAHKRLDTIEAQIKAVNQLATSLAAMTTEMGHVKESLHSIDSRLYMIEQKPGKRWEAVVGQVLSLLTAAAVGYFLGK
ncbi:MAG: hypothetical protein SPK23_01315 [Eubacteriales bacterium]|nr:hypothetical protein [Eubacteriales bacterium]